jgi:hypothetical protein
MGTGTAGAVIRDGVILPGPCEFGKLVLNVYQPLSHELRDRSLAGGSVLAAIDQSPPDMNGYASTKLLPLVFREVAEVPEGQGLDYESFEIGRLGAYYLGKETSVAELAYDLGRVALYTRSLQATVSEEEFDRVCRGKGDADLQEKVRGAGFPPSEDLYALCVAKGRQRIGEYERWVPQKYPEVRTGANFQECAKAMFCEVFDRAGSLLSDCIMVLRDLYAIDGVVLCGGVFARSASTARILQSIQVHLDRRYHVRFCGYDVYEEDDATKHVRKRAISTIYHNFLSDLSNVPQANSERKGDDKGEVGALYHAKILKYLSRIDPE